MRYSIYHLSQSRTLGSFNQKIRVYVGLKLLITHTWNTFFLVFQFHYADHCFMVCQINTARIWFISTPPTLLSFTKLPANLNHKKCLLSQDQWKCMNWCWKGLRKTCVTLFILGRHFKDRLVRGHQGYALL